MGHRTINTTLRYAHLGSQDIYDLPNPLEWIQQTWGIKEENKLNELLSEYLELQSIKDVDDLDVFLVIKGYKPEGYEYLEELQ